MKPWNTRALLALLLALVASLATAQEYMIRVTYNTNLRQSHSLDSAVLASARAGTTLWIVGQYDRWLQVERNGRYWMAAWVSHERVEDASSTQSRTDIDNCCYVNRQCVIDQQWVDGYWAYQRNECPAAGATTEQTLAQPVNTTPAEVNNCCFVNRQCATDQQWVDGYWAYQRNECTASGQVSYTSSHDIRIDGDELFRSHVNAALDLIQATSNHWYNYTIRGLDRIWQSPLGVLGVDTEAKSFALPNDYLYSWGEQISDDSSTWMAGVFVHEACHVYRDNENWPPYGYDNYFREEVICQQLQINALDAIDAPGNRYANYLSGLIKDWQSQGHEVPWDVIKDAARHPR